MLLMDIPDVPVQGATIVLAQAATAVAAPPPDYILKACEKVTNVGAPEPVMLHNDPASALAIYMQNQTRRFVDISAIRNVSLLKDASHGKISSERAVSGRLYYLYKPEPKYQGNDKAIFTADYAGYRFRIVVDIHVDSLANWKKTAACPPPQLLTVKKPVLGLSEYNSYSTPASFAASYNGFSLTALTMAIVLDLPPGSKHEGS